jgi:TetR/AcrR family fatty acid metabolism transcriptional regulator
MRVKEGNKEKDILDAAVKVFAKYGYHKTKVHNITESAGIATGSVYLYFKNKEAILDKLFEQLWEKLFKEITTLKERKDLNAAEKLDYLVDIFFDIFSENPKLAIVFVNEQNNIPHKKKELWMQYNEKFLEMGEEIIKEGIQNKIINPNINVKVFRFFLLGGIRHLLDNWAKDQTALSLSILKQNVKLLIKKGILI